MRWVSYHLFLALTSLMKDQRPELPLLSTLSLLVCDMDQLHLSRYFTYYRTAHSTSEYLDFNRSAADRPYRYCWILWLVR